MHNPHEVTTGDPAPRKRWKIRWREDGDQDKSVEVIARDKANALRLASSFINASPGKYKILSVTDETE